MKKWMGKTMFSIFAGAVLSLTLLLSLASHALPDTFTVGQGEHLDLSAMGLTVVPLPDGETAQANTSPNEKSYGAQVRLFSVLPVKTVTVTETEAVSVIPCGTPFGIKLFTDGVVVVGLSDISTAEGDRCPAAEAGICLGDTILEIDGEPVTKTEMVGQAMEESDGAPVSLKIQRDGETKTVTVTPVRSDFDGSYKGGIWVRDSTAGIGIVTFYQPENGMFGGLGHGICDVDTNNLMPLGKGEIVPVTISGVVKGRQGEAGELKGYFTDNQAVGQLERNGDTGVYGTLDSAPIDASPVVVARKQEVKKGPVQILTTVEGSTPKLYDAEIESLDLGDDTQVKNMVVRITDAELLQKTGGIVQGMSGSPILQEGKLVGAVTHVFVHDPTRGYGILAENMVSTADEIGKKLVKNNDAA